MAEWAVGQRCRVVEHDEATMQPREGGRSFPAQVSEMEGPYVLVFRDDEDGRTRRDQFWAESGWRAWDGELRWRLLPGTGDEAATAAGAEERN